MDNFIKALCRRKTVDLEEESELKRVLGLWDLLFLGLGLTLGVGTYILAGSVAKNDAGPAVCISFLVAAIASALSGLCYAEFACRVPKAGSAYTYSYVTMGEFVAYIIGWTLIFEYIVGIASLATALSGYIDTFTNKTISTTLRNVMPINVDFISSYPDFLSFGIMIFLVVITSNGAKESSILTNILTISNLIVILIVIGFGAVVANFDNWDIPKEAIPVNVTGGEGGFAPFGLAGILSGATRCFFAFGGFDAITTAADEARNPQKMLPLAIILCIFICFLAYFGISAVLTLMCPYYLQDEEVPFSAAFDYVDWSSVKWVAIVGAIFAMTSTLVAAMYALPRILYSMAKDGLLFKQLSYINSRTKTPVIAAIITGLFSGTLAMLLDINQLIEMLSLGTLLAYSIVSTCVLMLRYTYSNKESSTYCTVKHESIFHAGFYVFKVAFNLNGNKYPDKLTNSITNGFILIFCLLSIGICACTKFPIFTSISYLPLLVTFIILIILLLITMIIVARQPEEESNHSFKVPLVPLIPFASIFVNIALMFTCKIETYIRVVIWIAIGLLIYFGYGIRHSKERESNKGEQIAIQTIDTTRL